MPLPKSRSSERFRARNGIPPMVWCAVNALLLVRECIAID